jgi:F-type H+-transporting ATPase subunit epsilon
MSEGTFTLEVVTPQAKVFSGEVETVVAPGFLGDFGVLPGHVPYIAAMRPGVLMFAHDGNQHIYVAGAGFAEVGPDKVLLLTDVCEDASGVELSDAEARLEAAEKTLVDSDPTQHEYLDAEVDMALQVARIRAAGEIAKK